MLSVEVFFSATIIILKLFASVEIVRVVIDLYKGKGKKRKT